MTTHSSINSNHLIPLGSFHPQSEEIDGISVHPAANDDGRLLSQSDYQGGNLGYTSDKQAVGPPKAKASKDWFKLWWKELLAICFSLACLAVNVGILAALDKKPYQSWHVGRADITPNAIISVFATFSKAGLLHPVAEAIVQLKWLYFQARMQRVSDLQIFDDASRGPLGSLKLLWRLNIRSLLASLGALVIILALATEPFTQQIIRPMLHDSVATNVAASISKSNALATSDILTPEDDKALALSAYLQSLNVAANSGILGSVADALYDCPSGSCEWPPYSSLALCNSCVDIAPNFTTISCTGIPQNSSNHRLCSYSLSQDLSSMVFTNGAPLLAWTLWYQVDDTTWEPNTWMNITQDFTVGFDLESQLLKLAIVRFDAQYSSTSSSAPADILPTILSCELAWCAQYHSSSAVSDGKLFDESTISVPLVQVDSGYVPDNNAIPPGLAYALNETIEPFQIDNNLAEALQYLLASVVQSEVFNTSRFLLNDEAALGQLPSSYQSDYMSSFAAITSSSDGTVSADPASAQAIQGRIYSLYYANNGNIWKTLDSVAASTTSQLRSGLGSSNVTGEVKYPVTYIEVIWPWFIYPATLTVLAAVLLAATIVVSRNKLVWKSSSLALLFHGLSDEEASGKLVDTERLEAAASRMWAQLAEGEDRNVRLKKFR